MADENHDQLHHQHANDAQGMHKSHHKPTGHSEPHADKSPENLKAFVGEVLKVIKQQKPSTNKTTVSEVTHHLQSLDGSHPANLYRKAYGNIAQIFHKDNEIGNVFEHSSDVITLQSDEGKLEDARGAGVITSDEEAHIKTLNNAAAQNPNAGAAGEDPQHSAEPGQNHGPLHGNKGGATSTVQNAQAIITDDPLKA